MKVLAPPIREIHWPRFDGWITDYLLSGFQSLSPRALVRIQTHSGLPDPNERDVEEYVIYTLVEMNYSLSAISELFARREVAPKPDVNAIYAKVIAQQTPVGRAPLLWKSAFFDMLKLMRMHWETPTGALDFISGHPAKVRVTTKTVLIAVAPAHALASQVAIRRMQPCPEYKDVIRDLKKHAHEKFVTQIAMDSAGQYTVSLQIDWMLRHDLIPQNLKLYRCIRRKRAMKVI